MEAWLPVIILAVSLGVLMWAIARRQSAGYQQYLDRNVAESAKLVASQELTRLAVERQTAALERIAAALEQRGGG